ncbi:MAG: DUF4253 domain-containing protein [Kiritimatiellia bacterium]
MALPTDHGPRRGGPGRPGGNGGPRPRPLLAGPAGSPGRTRHAFARHVARRPDGRDPVYYAPDIVQQGTETLSRLAAILLVSDFWYFWWD